MTMRIRGLFVLTAVAFAATGCSSSAPRVTPYDSGGVTINGPSMLVRKSIAAHGSVAANYYIDMVSSASIDVQTSASPYDDERTQASLSMDFLHGKSTYSIGYVDSDESDYKAKTMFASVSHDMFGDLTTISFAFKSGQNDVFR